MSRQSCIRSGGRLWSQWTAPSARPPSSQSSRAGKAAIYGSIRDLGFDFRTDKISADDHRQESATLKREAVTVLAAIEQLRSHPPRGPAELERIIAGLAASTQEDAPSTESHELAKAGASAHPETPGAQLDGGPDADPLHPMRPPRTACRSVLRRLWHRALGIVKAS